MTSLAYALARAELIRALTAYTGITTADGDFDGVATIVDANLKGRNDFITEKTILIMSGPAAYEDKGAASFDSDTGIITLQGTGFSAQIKAGTIFRILNTSSIEIDVDTINTKIGTNTDAAGITTLFAWLAKISASGAAISGAVSDAAPATTDFDTDLTEATDDHFNGMLLMFLNGPNVAQAHTIHDYDGAAKNVAFRVGDQWTDVPVNGNSFIILPSAALYLDAEVAAILEDTAAIDGHITADYGAAQKQVLDDWVDAGRLDAILDAIKAETDKIAGKMLFSMDFWSLPQEEVEVDAAGGTETLPSVTVAGLPGGITIVRAVAMFKFRMVENVFAGANGLNGAQHIQVQSDAPGTWRDAISVVDTLCTFTEAAREGGDIWIGDHNIEVEITAHLDDIYSFQWIADALQEFIRFNDVQTGLRIWYSV